MPDPFVLVSFLGSFLLFALELIAARLLLPAYGGAASVWTTAMMFFQGALFFATLYAQAAQRRFPSAKGYARWHAALLALPVVFFPLAARDGGRSSSPVFEVCLALLAGVGVPFFTLSTTSPVIQRFALSRGLGEDEAYSLYSASNAGALLCLAAYPFLIEPRLGLAAQIRCWEILYAVYACLHWFCLPGDEAEKNGEASSKDEDFVSWVMLAAGPSAALLAVTNLLSLDLAAVPLLWIGPLAIYLLTLVLAFKRRPWAPRLGLVFAFGAAAWTALVLVTVRFSAGVPEGWHVLRRLWVVNKSFFYLAALFVVAWLCHRKLSESRPGGGSLARFYAATALGGWAGGLLIGVAMPLLGRRLAMPELDWAVAGVLSLGALLWRDSRKPVQARGQAPGRATLAAFGALGAAALAFYVSQSPAFAPGLLEQRRDFYGYYRVVDDGVLRRFYHGNTMHGLAYDDPARAREPLLYFHRGSPLGEVFAQETKKLKSVAVLGLGVGSTAAYARPGQAFTFYELDPAVEDVARRRFHFLDGGARVVTGDGRLRLAASADRYDLIVVDVFTGGAIPVHLLTREALAVYESRLAPDGVVLFHVTNRFLNLRPVLAALARDGGWSGAAKSTDPRGADEQRYFSSWVLLAKDAKRLAPYAKEGWTQLSSYGTGLAPWTDDHASLLSALDG